MSLCLEVTEEKDRLKIGIHGADDVIWHYQDIPAKMERIETISRNMIETLNILSRKGGHGEEVIKRLEKDGEALCGALLKPEIIKKLENTDSDHLILKIDDNLVHIPWELIYFNKKFLSLRFSMGRIVKTRQKIFETKERDKARPFNIWVMADPGENLAAAGSEGMRICEEMDVVNKNGNIIEASFNADITRDEIVERIKDFDFVHFAGHAEFDPSDPGENCWVVTDGTFSATDIDEMAGNKPMPFFVFSNACQSARTDKWEWKEGAQNRSFGLANSFLLAGVRHYMGTCWEIIDEPGNFFAVKFYKLLTSGKSIGEAVRISRIELINKYGYDFIGWGSYILYGDPRVIYFDDTDIKTGENNFEFPITQISEDNNLTGHQLHSAVTRSPKSQRWQNTILLIAILLASITTVMFNIIGHDKEKKPSVELLRLLNEQDMVKQKEIYELINKIEGKLSGLSPKSIPSDQWTSDSLTMVIDYDAYADILKKGRESIIFSVIQSRIIDSTRIKCLERKSFASILREADLSLSKLVPADKRSPPRLLVPRYFLFLSVNDSDDRAMIIMRLTDRKRTVIDVWHEMLQEDIPIVDQADKFCKNLLEKLDFLETENPLRGIITEADNHETVMNIGTDAGVEPGQRFRIIGKNTIIKVVVAKSKYSIMDIVDGNDTAVVKGLKTEAI